MSTVLDHNQHVDGVVPPGSPSEQRHGQVPISRPVLTGYERPERARTSHACEPCRERKTKCDGERPSCRRCLHTGTGCHYGYGKGWKKRKTQEDLSVTSRKLARYENLLTEIIPLVPPEIRIMIEEARQQEISPTHTTDSRDSSTPSSNPTPDGEHHKSASPSSNRLPLPMPLPPAQPQNNSVPPPRSMPIVSTTTSPPPQSPPAVPPLMKPGAEDLSGALRLPSIARNGMLLERSTQSSAPPVHAPHSPTTARLIAQAAVGYPKHGPDGII